MVIMIRWVGRGAILRPGWRWRRQRALPHIHVSLVDIQQIIQVSLRLEPKHSLTLHWLSHRLIKISSSLSNTSYLAVIIQLHQVDRKLIEGAKRLNTNVPESKWVVFSLTYFWLNFAFEIKLD